MAALFQPAENSEHVTSRKESFNEETLDQSCDVILVVEDGKEFKTHKRVLSEASPFFEKLFNSDMKESKEGMVRLEMFSESVMRNTLEFIYTGSVQILAEDNARLLIVMADYLLLENLKTLAEDVLVQKLKLNTSNCISIYCFSQKYQCEGLFAKTKTFIVANFTVVYEANREEVLNMSSKEFEMLISSDEIDVSAEEDVFKFILAWIDCDKSKRKKYFAELFRQVRLVYVSRDFLCSDIVTNELVKYNEDCLNLVEDALSLIDSKNYDYLSITPRKSLETPVILCTDALARPRSSEILCYFARDDRWCSLGRRPHSFVDAFNVRFGQIESCRGKVYHSIGLNIPVNSLEIYNPYSKCWTSLHVPYRKDDRKMRQIFVRNEDEMYALMEDCDREFDTTEDRKRHVITKYKPESSSWEDVSSFDHFNPEGHYCIVAKDNFIYFIGGDSWCDVDRYDLSRDQWDKVASIQETKISPCGAVANGKIFIAEEKPSLFATQCEMYNETTNEWQFLASFNLYGSHKLLSVDGKLYALAIDKLSVYHSSVIQCYDSDKNEWNREIEIPRLFSRNWHDWRLVNACSVRIFKGFLGDISDLADSGNEITTSTKCKCFIL